jgi:hypothetical protein
MKSMITACGVAIWALLIGDRCSFESGALFDEKIRWVKLFGGLSKATLNFGHNRRAIACWYIATDNLYYLTRTTAEAAVLSLIVLGTTQTIAMAGGGIGETAFTTASNFRDSIGVSAHWEYKNSVYRARSEEIIAAIARLGVRHVRGYDSLISRELEQIGIGSMLVAGPEIGLPEAIADIIVDANATGSAIDAVEGPNEPDLFWPLHGYSYKGQGFPFGVIAYQRDLYQALKQRRSIAGVPVIGPSLGKTYDPPSHPNPFPGGSLTQSVDFGNFHPYPFGGNSFSDPFAYDTISKYYWNGNFPSVNLDEFPYAYDVYDPPFAPKSMMATETGYSTGSNGVSEAVQAKYIPRLFAEYLRLGIQRTYLYEFADLAPDPSGQNMDKHFGLVRSDLLPKPAYIALRSLIDLVTSVPNAGAEMANPSVEIFPHMPAEYDRLAYVHSLLVRQSESQALLLVWHEVASADTSVSPPRSIEVPLGNVDLSVSQPFSAVVWYDYGPDWEFRPHPVPAGIGRLSLPLKDEIVAVVLRNSSP